MNRNKANRTNHTNQSKCCLILALLLCLCCFTCAACGTEQAQTPEATETTETTESTEPTEIPAASILNYLPEDENCSKLMAAMTAGEIPTACEVLYDEMGARPTVTVTDEATIIELYELFSQITVGEKTAESVTDSYHHITFTLQDGTEVRFGFEADIWCCGTGTEDRVKVENTAPLWSKVKALQDETAPDEN